VININRKIIRIIIFALFLSTSFASAVNTIEVECEKIRKDRLFVFGKMEQIDFGGGSIDFKVISFVIIKDGKDITKLNNEESIRFYAPMIGLLFNNFLIGFFSDWEILE